MTILRGMLDADGNPIVTILLPEGIRDLAVATTPRVPLKLGELRKQLGAAPDPGHVCLDAEGGFRLAGSKPAGRSGSGKGGRKRVSQQPLKRRRKRD